MLASLPQQPLPLAKPQPPSNSKASRSGLTHSPREDKEPALPPR